MSKVFTADEVKKHTTRSSVWIVIRNDVYDVTAFIGEHPGGEDPLLEAAGQDATIAFDDVGHSSSARSMLKKYKIGSLAPGQGCPRPSTKSMKSNKVPAPPRVERRVQQIVVPIEPRPRRPRGPPCGVPEEGRGRSRRRAPPPKSSKLKWALLALGLAIIIGVAFKKYAT